MTLSTRALALMFAEPIAIPIETLLKRGFRPEYDGGEWYGLIPNGSDRLCEDFQSKIEIYAVLEMLANRILPKGWTIRPVGTGVDRYQIDLPNARTGTLWTDACQSQFPGSLAHLMSKQQNSPNPRSENQHGGLKASSPTHATSENLSSAPPESSISRNFR